MSSLAVQPKIWRTIKLSDGTAFPYHFGVETLQRDWPIPAALMTAGMIHLPARLALLCRMRHRAEP
jgi:hypothetical protein